LSRRNRRKADPVGSVVVECLLLDIALGLYDVMYNCILLSILPASTTVTPVSFPGTVRYIVHRHPWYVRAREKLEDEADLTSFVPSGVAAALLLPLLRPSEFLSLPSRASLNTVRVGIRRGNADPACRVRSSRTMAVDDDDASTAPSMVQPEPPSPLARYTGCPFNALICRDCGVSVVDVVSRRRRSD
jgi:hypothetical protein